MDNMWGDLSDAQRERLAQLRVVDSYWQKGDVELLDMKLATESGGKLTITPKGRAVFAAGNPQADAGAAGVEDDDNSVTVTDAYNNNLWETGTLLVHNYGQGFEVIRIEAKNARGQYHLIGRANSCYRLGDDGLDYTPATDELADLRAQLAEAQAERDAALDKLTETRLFKVVEFVWLTTKQPQIERYLMEWFPEIIINIEDRKERADDAGSE